MKIISKKKWEEMNQKIVDIQMDLNESRQDNKTYFAQVEALRKQNTNIKAENESCHKEIENIANQLVDKDKEVRKLKALLTKNKIDYKHLYKEKK